MLERDTAATRVAPPHNERPAPDGAAPQPQPDAPLVSPAILSVMNVMRTVDQD